MSEHRFHRSACTEVGLNWRPGQIMGGLVKCAVKLKLSPNTKKKLLKNQTEHPSDNTAIE